MPNTQIRKILSVGIPVLFLWFVAFEWVARDLPTVQYLTRALFALCCLIWLTLRVKSNRSFVLPSSIIPMAVFIAYQGILILRAPLKIHSFEVELGYIIYLLVFIFVVDSLNNWWQNDHWENALLNLAILFSVFNFALVVIWWLKWASLSGDFFSTPPFGYRLPGLFLKHPNYEAAFLNLVTPIILIRTFQSSRWSRRIGWAAVFILFLAVEFFTSSRAGWVGLFMGCGTTLMLYVLPILKRGRAELHRLVNFIKTAKGAFLVVIILAGFISLGLIFLWQANLTGHAPISSARTNIWTIGWNIFQSSPFLGYGPGSFHILSAVEAQIPPGFFLVHAHNLFLQVAAEGGIVGIILLALIAFVGCRDFIRAWNIASKSRRNRLAAYAGAAVGMSVHHIFDFAFESPLYTISFLILAALAIYDLRGNSYALSPRKWGIPVLSALIALYLIVSIYTLRGLSLYFSGIQLVRDNQWEEGTSKICQAADENPQMTLFDFQCGLAEATSAMHLEENNRVSLAAFHIRRGLNYDSFWPVHWVNLAAIEWSMGHHSIGLELMEKAVDLAPRNSTFTMNLGWMYEQTGNADAAQAAYRQAILVDPWLIGTTAYRRIIGQRIDSSKLIQEVQRYRSWSNPGVGRSELTKGHYKDAENLFNLSIRVNPRNVDSYSGLALVYLKSNDLSNAERMAKLALLINASSSRAHLVAGQVAFEKGDERQAMIHFMEMFHLLSTHNSSFEYYESTYFRASLPFDIAPQVIQTHISDEMIEELERLTTHLEELGEEQDAQGIRDWIIQATNDISS
jgi:tetratricopeptide (TPR) repeat protein/O-antigen ligase